MDNKQLTDDFFNWVDSVGYTREQVCEKLGVNKRTISNWKSLGIPVRKVDAVKELLSGSMAMNVMILKPTYEQFKKWNQAALDAGQLVEDWAFSGLEEVANEYFAANVFELPYMGMAAAGQPVESQVKGETIAVKTTEKLPVDTFIVEVNGQSMEPALADGDLIAVKPMEYSPGNNKVCVVTDGHGVSVKRWIKGRGYVSDNPAFPGIQPAEEVKLQGYFIAVVARAGIS